MLEIILWVLGLTFGYFLIKEAVRKGVLEAHEELGDYQAPVTKVERKKPEEKQTVINNWICPHCDAINTSESVRCIKCGKLPTER